LANLLLTACAVQATVPAQVKTQVPGYFRLNVGNFEVTAVFDGYNDLSPDLIGLSLSPYLSRSAGYHIFRSCVAHRNRGSRRVPVLSGDWLIFGKRNIVSTGKSSAAKVEQAKELQPGSSMP
jgi:hypothetical protein